MLQGKPQNMFDIVQPSSIDDNLLVVDVMNEENELDITRLMELIQDPMVSIVTDVELEGSSHVHDRNSIAVKIWKLKLPAKLQLFIWTFLMNALPTGPHDHINPSLPPTATYYRWSKPLGPFCTLNTDGSVAKGRSGIGGIVRNSHGDPILAFASRCPKMPVYAVELWAIRRGLQLALSSGVRYVNVDTDSTEAVKCVYSLPANCPLL
ncbi:hypothetical protein FRX31_024961, partial [Thalictrum thalictroides]